MPARRTRRQKTKREEEQPEEPVAEAAAEGATDQPETSVETATVDVEAEPPATTEQSDKPESEPASKPARLTRGQQAKLEEEKKEVQAKQQKPQVEPNENVALEEIITEAKAQAEAVIGRDGIITQETAHEETNKLGKIAHAAATETSVVQDNGEMTVAQDELVHVNTKDIVEACSALARKCSSKRLFNHADITVETVAPAGCSISARSLRCLPLMTNNQTYPASPSSCLGSAGRVAYRGLTAIDVYLPRSKSAYVFFTMQRARTESRSDNH
jgi:outer membrane biosynthesis protein TonB